MPVEPRSFEAARAQAVLDDCMSALHVLEENPRGVRWRLTWCSTLTLLRAVGHVLGDEAQSPAAAPELREWSRVWWQQLNETKPEPAIFWQFIERDRNALIKEYRFSAEQGVIMRGGPPNTLPVGTSPIGGGIIEPTYLMKDGPFTGRDQRDLVEEAISWWQEQLDEINTRAVACLIEARLSNGVE